MHGVGCRVQGHLSISSWWAASEVSRVAMRERCRSTCTFRSRLSVINREMSPSPAASGVASGLSLAHTYEYDTNPPLTVASGHLMRLSGIDREMSPSPAASGLSVAYMYVYDICIVYVHIGH